MSATNVQQFVSILARNSAFGLAAQVLTRLLSFGFSILIVRHLGAGMYGQYAGVLAFGAMFVFVSDLGLSGFTVREVARYRECPTIPTTIGDLFATVLALRLVLSIVAATLLVITAWLTGRPLVMVIAIALGALGLILYGVQGTADALLAGFERLDLSSGAKVANQLAFVLVGAIFVWLGFGYYGLIYANLLGVALMTCCCLVALRTVHIRLGRVVIQQWPSLLKASFPFGIVGFTLGISYKFDSVLLSVFWGDADTGYYNAAYNLVFSAAVLANVLNTTLYPSLTRLAIIEPQLVPGVCRRMFRYLMVLALPITVGAWALADRLVPVLFTGAYAPAIPVLRVIIWTTPFMFASEFLGYLVVIHDNESRAARSVVVSTGINALLNVILIPRYGIVLAAVTTVLTEAVLVGQYAWVLRTVLRQIDWGRTLVRPLLAAGATGGLILMVHDLPLLVDIVLGGISYAGLLLALGGVSSDDLSFLRRLRSRGEFMVAGAGPPVQPQVIVN